MNEKDKLLITLLARVDVIHRPFRRMDWLPTDGSRVACELREAYHANGIYWRTSGSSTTRSRAERLLSDAASTGLIVLGGEPGKHRRIRFTERGEAVGRGLAGLPSLIDSWAILKKVAALTVIHDVYGRLCAETWAAGLSGYSGDYHIHLARLQDAVAPSALRGWVYWRSDIYGTAYAALTDSGVAAAQGPKPVMPNDLPAPAAGGHEHYYSSLKFNLWRLFDVRC